MTFLRAIMPQEMAKRVQLIQELPSGLVENEGQERELLEFVLLCISLGCVGFERVEEP